MKIINKFLIVALTIFMVSCDNLSDINIDPNNSETARPQEVLTSVQNYTAFVMDAQYNDWAFIWGQYWCWGTGVSLGDYARYIQEPRDANQAWARTYSNALADVKFLKEVDDPAYNGIAKVLEAFIYQYAVDHFGDIPYSQAINGAIADGSVLAPVYDDDAAIYPQLVTTLDAALVDLAAAGGGNVHGEDLIYAGDLHYWQKFAHSLKLRILMRMSNVNDVAAEVRATVAGGEFIESSADISEVPFTGDAGSENPMFAWEESGIGLFYKAATTVTDVMDATFDPRGPYFYKDAINFPGEIKSADQNWIALCFTCIDEDWSDPSDVTYGAGVPTIFMSDWETWFLRAEAAVRFGTVDDDEAAFANAIQANFDYIGAPNAGDFVGRLGYAGSSDADKLNMIAVQKWISMTGLQEAEGWIESRRFDTPGNTIFGGGNGIFQTPLTSSLPDGVFPSRWLYPESEQNLNSSFPGQASVTDKVFWDN